MFDDRVRQEAAILADQLQAVAQIDILAIAEEAFINPAEAPEKVGVIYGARPACAEAMARPGKVAGGMSESAAPRKSEEEIGIARAVEQAGLFQGKLCAGEGPRVRVRRYPAIDRSQPVRRRARIGVKQRQPSAFRGGGGEIGAGRQTPFFFSLH